MIKYLLLSVGILTSALAQILLKKASFYEIKSIIWLIYILLSITIYGGAFIIYSIILKYYPISVASPVMTIGVMIIVFCFGAYIGEHITPKQIIGFALGLVSVYFLLVS
jgi:drug/metabolite transporter (DMT)-like permease